MEIQIAIAKVDRYSSPEQGDQVEVVERPNGGISVILGEGKLNGSRSKFVARKAVHRVLSFSSMASMTGRLRALSSPPSRLNTTVRLNSA